MLSYKIPKVVVGLPNFLTTLNERRAIRHQLPATTTQPPITFNIPWSKIEYTHFVEATKKLYRVGQIVALSVSMSKEGTIPPLYRITYINELMHNTRFDSFLQEPLVLTITPIYGGVAMERCRCQIRSLTKEEEDLVKLQNTKPVATA